MGCGGNCACDAAANNTNANEILEAISPDGRDITDEIVGRSCAQSECQKGACEKCQSDDSGTQESQSHCRV